MLSKWSVNLWSFCLPKFQDFSFWKIDLFLEVDVVENFMLELESTPNNQKWNGNNNNNLL